ncbi:Calx-beta domain-containing protein [Rubrivirga sp. IMCC43871]|uniref:DUF7933 domain-containing protein n=1 Tax=Rubrivirga sp. IMCC43871 TaxID=3391575 RepID=UPI00398FF364
MDLVVDPDSPGFTGSFAPASVPLGSRSTLTLTIDNTLNASGVATLDFTDVLPDGLEVAAPSNASTTCGTSVLPPSLHATPGTRSVILDADGTGGFPAVAAGASCSVVVDVVAVSAGTFDNVVSLLADFEDTGFAAARVEVAQSTLSLAQSFVGDPIAPGGSVPLQFTIRNRDRQSTAAAIAFTDDLGATLAGLAANGTPINACGGTLTGTAVLTFSGGTLPAGGTCTFEVPLTVPAGAAQGAYTNTTSAISGTIAGQGVAGAPASDQLFVAPVPILTLAFADDPVGSGESVTLEFTITNSSATDSAADIAFDDEFTFLPFPLDVTLPADGFCGPGSMATVTSAGNERQQISVRGASLAAGASCTFGATVAIPVDLASGTYTNTTSPITATVDGQDVAGQAASDDLVVVSAPRLTQEFLDDPVLPGGAVTLRFTLSSGAEEPMAATGVSFSDDLDTVLPGLTAVAGPPLLGCGGALTGQGTGDLTFSGGTVQPGGTCQFDVELSVPTGATSGTYSNSTSSVSATVGGVATASPPASDDLVVSALSFTKAFVDDPVQPGGTVTLEFTVQNLGTEGASELTFTDNLSAVVPGLAATGLPSTDVCGVGSQLMGTSFLILTGGNLAAGESCTFSATLDVPGGAAADQYGNTTSNLSGSVGGQSVTLPPATDMLVVAVDSPPLISKSFAPDAIPLGGVSTLTLTIDNSASTTAATGLDVTDAFPPGLEVAPVPNAGTSCAGGTLTAAAGSATISYTGGALAAGDTCTIAVDVTSGTAGDYVNTTGDLTSSNGLSGTASATLRVRDVNVIATKVGEILADDGDGQADPGETILYTVAIATGGGDVANAAFTDTPGSGLTLVAGSVSTSAGTIQEGNGTGDTSIVIDLGSRRAGAASIEISFEATVNEDLPVDAAAVCNQGTVSSDIPDVVTDDPTTPAEGDPTCTAAASSPVASFDVDTNSGSEGGAVTLVVTLDAPARGRESVDVVLTEGSPQDLGGFTSATLRFDEGDTEASVELSLTDDGPGEGTEELTFELQNPTFLTIGVSETVLTVREVGVLAMFRTIQQSVVEDAGSVVLVIHLADAAPGDATLEVTLASGDRADLGGFASARVDVPSGPGAPTRLEVVIPVTDDERAEDDEQFLFELSVVDEGMSPSGGPAIGIGSPSQTALVVVDNDGEPLAVTIPARDADSDGVEDGGLRAFAVPVGGLTAAEVAEVAGAEPVFSLGLAGQLTAVDPTRSLSAGQMVVIDVAPEAVLTFTGSAPMDEVALGGVAVNANDDEAADRVLVAVGNPTDHPIGLDDLAVDGGTLADVVLVFDADAGAFRPLSLAGLDAESVSLAAYAIVVVQVILDGDAADVAVRVPASATAAPGSSPVQTLAFGPTDGETAVVLELRSSASSDATAGRIAEAPGDTFVLRFGPGTDGLDPFDGVDVRSPFGGTLAGFVDETAFAALAVGDSESVTLPLAVAVSRPGAYEIALASLPGSLNGRPVVVEILDGASATEVAAGEPFAFTAASPGSVSGLRLRVSASSGVATEDAPAGASLSVFPNPAPGPPVVELAVPEAGVVRVVVFDALGRTVAVLHDGPLAAGSARWALGSDLPPGAYLIQAGAASFMEVRSFTVVR